MQSRFVFRINIYLFQLIINIKGKQSDFLNEIPLEQLLGPKQGLWFLSQLHFNGNDGITTNDMFSNTRKPWDVAY